jgi:hypothetical protein
MFTLKQIGESVGNILRPVSLKDAAEVFGIRPPFSFKELSSAAESGKAPQPFYVIGHNTNTIEDVRMALEKGANAVEIDVNVYEDNQGELCISEAGKFDKDEGGDSDAPTLEQFLKELHVIVSGNPEKLALVIFDCKPKVGMAEHGVTLLKAIRALLTFDNALNIIISVAKFSDVSIFEKIRFVLHPLEGVMIDEENDPTAITKFFAGVGPICYGNGVAHAFQSPLLSPHVRLSIEKACALRATSGNIKWIYTWTLGTAEFMREYLNLGVNGIIPGKASSTFDAEAVGTLRSIVDQPEFKSTIRLAARIDNPFARPDTAYGLQIQTGAQHDAGTDANLTFTLTGTLGSSSKTIDASTKGSLPGKMENSALDFVTLECLNLGTLLSITVQRDDEGNAPDWFLDHIVISSFRYGVTKQANFNRWIDSTLPFTVALT